VLEVERAHGTKVGVLQGDVAGKLLVSARDATSGEPAVVMVDADEIGVMRREYRLVDGRGAALVSFDGVRVERLQPESGESAAAALADIRDEAAVALCAESLGIVNSVMTVTTEYLRSASVRGRSARIRRASIASSIASAAGGKWG